MELKRRYEECPQPTLELSVAYGPRARAVVLQVNSRTHVLQELTGLIPLCTPTRCRFQAFLQVLYSNRPMKPLTRSMGGKRSFADVSHSRAIVAEVTPADIIVSFGYEEGLIAGGSCRAV